MGVSFTGCTFLKQNPEFTRAVLQIGLKYAVMTLVGKNPNAEQHVQVIAKVLEDPVGILKPESLKKELQKAIDRNIDGRANKMLVKDLADQVLSFYKDVYNSHKDTLDQATYIKIMQAMGSSIRMGLTPEIPASHPAVFYSKTHEIIIQ